MTELEAKAKDCIENHTHKLVDKPTEQDIYLREESIYISGYKQGLHEGQPKWHEPSEIPSKNPVIIQTVNGNITMGFYMSGWKEVISCKDMIGVYKWTEIPTFKE